MKNIISTPIEDYYADTKRSAREDVLSCRDVKLLLDSLPDGVSQIVKFTFLNGKRGFEISDWDLVMQYFNKASKIIPELTRNPGTFTMLNRIYRNEDVVGNIDKYFYNSIAGQSLRNRLEAVASYLYEIISNNYSNQKIKIIDLGSGPGDYPIRFLLDHPKLIERVEVDCIDSDNDAIEDGQKLASKYDLPINFYCEDILKYRHYKNKADIGLLIGILCPLNHNDGSRFLRVMNRYLKNGGILIAATLLDFQLEKDLFSSFLLREITGWKLDYKPIGALHQMFESAGYEWIDNFSDEPTNFYDIDVGKIKY